MPRTGKSWHLSSRNDTDSPIADTTTADEPDVPEAGRASSGDAEGVPGGGSLRPGEEVALDEGTAEAAPDGDASHAAVEPESGETETGEQPPSNGEAAR